MSTKARFIVLYSHSEKNWQVVDHKMREIVFSSENYLLAVEEMKHLNYLEGKHG